MSNLIIERAKSAEMAHDFATAARLYKELLSQDNTNVEYLSELGKIYVTAGEDKKALPYFEQIHDFHPDNVEAMTALGGIYRRLGRYEESTSILMKALETGKDQQNVFYNLGFTFKEMKNYEDAIDAFENVIAMNPRDVLTHNHLGSIYLESNELDKAVAAYKHGLQIDPNHPILNYNLARTYTKLKNYPDAVRSYEAALKTRPNWPEAIRNFSNLLVTCQKSEEAARIVKQSIKIHPNDPELLYSLGQVYLNQFDFSNAQKTFRQASEIKENDVKILTALASAYEKADESDKALETILSAIELEPLNNDARMQYVDTLLSVSDYDSAFKTLETMTEETPEPNVKMMDLYGQYFITQGENEKAEKYYEQIRKKDHHYKNYLLGASKRFVQLEKLDDAEKYAREYVKSRASRAEGYNMLGKIYTKADRLEDAKEILQKGMSVVRPNVYATKQTEMILAMQKDACGDADVEELLLSSEPAAAEPVPAPAENENISLADNLSFPEADEFDADVFGDDAELKPADETSLDEMSEIDGKLEDDGEALIMPEDDTDYSTDELLDAVGDADSKEPENTLKPEDSEDFNDVLMDSFGGDADSIPEAEELPSDEDGAGAPEGEIAPEQVPVKEFSQAPVQQPSTIQQPVYNINAPSQEELAAILNATKTAQEALRLAQEAEKRVDEVEERQKQLEEGLSDEMLDEPEIGGDTESVEETDDLPMAEELSNNEELDTENTFITVDDVLGADEPEPETAQTESEPSENAFFSSVDDEFALPAENSPDSDFDAEFAAEMETNLSTSLFVTVDELYSELLSKIGDIDDSDAAEKLSKLAEKIEEGEINPVESQTVENQPSEFKAPEEAPAVGGENCKKLSEVAEMLKKIEAILSDDELARKYTKEISLLKHLKVLCEYLPNDEKIAFASGRIRMLIDYLLSKMSGRPGLLLTAQSLLKSGVLGEEYRVQLISDCEEQLNNEMIRRVLVYMKKLSESLEDFGLAAALRACADGALEKIEMKNQRSEIF